MCGKKVSDAEKIIAVQEYLGGNGSTIHHARELGVGIRTFSSWIDKYKIFGEEGLLSGPGHSKYTAEIKQTAVQSYLKGEGS